MANSGLKGLRSTVHYYDTEHNTDKINSGGNIGTRIISLRIIQINIHVNIIYMIDICLPHQNQTYNKFYYYK